MTTATRTAPAPAPDLDAAALDAYNGVRRLRNRAYMAQRALEEARFHHNEAEATLTNMPVETPRAWLYNAHHRAKKCHALYVAACQEAAEAEEAFATAIRELCHRATR
jgi:hypothetical protein